MEVAVSEGDKLYVGKVTPEEARRIANMDQAGAAMFSTIMAVARAYREMTADGMEHDTAMDIIRSLTQRP